jgi:hypothetical protein
VWNCLILSLIIKGTTVIQLSNCEGPIIVFCIYRK